MAAIVSTSAAASFSSRMRPAARRSSPALVAPFHSPAKGCSVSGGRRFLSGVSCAAAPSSKPGGSVLDAPSSTVISDLEKSFSMKKPPTYKVMLHNDNYNRREYVVKILIKVVQGFTVDDAVVTMQQAHEAGVALVVACPQEDAERYCEALRLNGLTSTIEPGC